MRGKRYMQRVGVSKQMCDDDGVKSEKKKEKEKSLSSSPSDLS